jgi:GNAT superfamily N-acetyltransferase
LVNSLPPHNTGSPIEDRPVTLVPARPEEADILGDLAIRSKAFWGYDQAFLAACREELTVESDAIDSPENHYAVARIGKIIAGFYALAQLRDKQWELDALFVDPPFIGRGIGSRLLAHAVETAVAEGGRSIRVQSDPWAETFYRRAGAIPVGFEPSGSIPGRILPVLELVPVGSA